MNVFFQVVLLFSKKAMVIPMLQTLEECLAAFEETANSGKWDGDEPKLECSDIEEEKGSWANGGELSVVKNLFANKLRGT